MGEKAIDQNWWQGFISPHRQGIFPITHVYHLEAGDTTTITPPSDQMSSARIHNAPPASSSAAPVAQAIASMDLTAQLGDELGFKKGDLIKIFEAVDAEFAIGECNGKMGTFPLAFVEVIEGNLNIKIEKQEKRRSKFRWWEEEQDGDGNTQPIEPTSVQVSNHTSSYTQQHINGADQAPVSNYSQQQSQDNHVRSHKRMNSRGSYTQENTRSYDSELTAYGKTVFPFIAENPNELTVMDNEIVNLIQHIDEQWIEGEIDGMRGIFPASYVEIIVDCPWASTPQKEDIPAVRVADSNSSEVKPLSKAKTDINTAAPIPASISTQVTFPRDTYGRAVYDFNAETPQDLALKEGDTVTLTQQMDEFWYEARHDDGRVGFCPVEYIEILPGVPEPEPEPVDVSVPQSAGASEPNRIETSAPHAVETKSTPPRSLSPPKPAITKPKPAMKPKPQLKPKPGAKSPSDLQQSPVSPNVPREPPAIPARAVDHQKPEVPLVPPEIPARAIEQQQQHQQQLQQQQQVPAIPARAIDDCPVITRSVSSIQSSSKPCGVQTALIHKVQSAGDFDLNSIILGQMKEAKLDAESRSRSSSMLTDSSGTKSRSNSSSSSQESKSRSSSNAADWSKWTSEDFSAQLTSPTTPNTFVKSPTEKRVAFSTFYIQSDPAPGPAPAPIARPRPAPNRPAQPPPALTRQRSGSTKKAPPRPRARAAGGGNGTGQDSSVQLVPQRPAPPRPGAAPSRPVGDDLMAFSPDRENAGKRALTWKMINVAVLRKPWTAVMTLYSHKPHVTSLLQVLNRVNVGCECVLLSFNNNKYTLFAIID